MTWTDWLVNTLQSEGATIIRKPDQRGLIITAYRGDEYSPKIDFALSDAELLHYLEEIGADAQADFSEAGYRLFLVHLDEEVATCDKPELTITLVNQTLVSTRSSNA